MPRRAEARDRSSGVRGFHGPDALLQPVDQREIVSGAAKERLAKMNVSLNKAGDNGAAGGVDNRVGCLAGATNARDASVANEQIAAHDGVRGVHRDERAVFDEDRLHIDSFSAQISYKCTKTQRNGKVALKCMTLTQE